MDDMRFGLHRALRKTRQDLSRATPRSTSDRATDSARLTVRWVGDSSAPGARLAGVVTQEPAPMYARSARTGMPWRPQIRRMRWVRAAVRSCARPGRQVSPPQPRVRVCDHLHVHPVAAVAISTTGAPHRGP